MSFQPVHQVSPQKTQIQKNTSQLAARTLPVQAQQGSDRFPTYMADSQMQGLEQAARLGHHFVNIPVHPPGIQASVAIQRKHVTDNLPVPDAEQRPNRTGLPDHLKAGIEHLSGFSLDKVKVYYNSDKPAQLNALAYAQGTNIHVAPGQDRHLAHEAWHVVQQAQGRVWPTIQTQSESINDDEGLEHEADEMSAKALQVPRVEPNEMEMHYRPSAGPNAGIIQTISMVRYHATQNYQYSNPPGGPLVGLNAFTQVATGMSAELDRTDPIHGSGVGAGIPANTTTDLGMKFPVNWVLGHLLNNNLGGLGISSNLFPITIPANLQHTWAVEDKVKDEVYNQPLGGNFALGNHGYLQYQVMVNPLVAPPSTLNPDANLMCSYRTQANQPGPAMVPVWNPWTHFIVKSRAAGPAPVPAAWAPFGAGIGMPLGGGGVVNVASWHVQILTNPANANHGAMLGALGLAAPPAAPAGAQFFLTQQTPAPPPPLKIIGWQF